MKQGIKQLSLVVAVLAQAAVTEAITVDVNFASLGTQTIELTSQNDNSPSLDGVTFSYDKNDPVDFAQISSAGVSGTADGSLRFSFVNPANVFEYREVSGMDFDFTLTGVSTPIIDALVVGLSFVVGGEAVPIGNLISFDIPAGNEAGGVAFGHFHYANSSFNQADLFFYLDGDPAFTLDNFSYEVPTGGPTGVPDPASTLALLMMGVVGIGGGRACLRRR